MDKFIEYHYAIRIKKSDDLFAKEVSLTHKYSDTKVMLIDYPLIDINNRLTMIDYTYNTINHYYEVDATMLVFVKHPYGFGEPEDTPNPEPFKFNNAEIIDRSYVKTSPRKAFLDYLGNGIKMNLNRVAMLLYILLIDIPSAIPLFIIGIVYPPAVFWIVEKLQMPYNYLEHENRRLIMLNSEILNAFYF